MTLYDRISGSYDTTRRADPYLATRLAVHLAPVFGGRYLDAGCGTGNYTVALAAAAPPGARFVGVDLSARMIAASAGKAAIRMRNAPARRAPACCAPAWLVADVAALPLPTGSIDGAICTLALHHFPDLTAALAEIGRVVRYQPGSRLVILTALPEQIVRYWLARYFPVMIDRAAAHAIPLDSLREALAAADFPRVATEPYDVRPDLEDLFLYAGKYRPALYLDTAVRAGISSFAALADPTELRDGLARLAGDIDTGRIAAVIASAEHAGGDYLFVRAER